MAQSVSDALAELRSQFTEQLSTRLDSIHAHFQRLAPAAWQPDEAEALYRLLHGLTSSASTFGMQSVSDAARALGTRLATLLKCGAAPTEAAWQELGVELNYLDQLARIWLQSSAPSQKPPLASTLPDRAPLIYLVEDDPAQAGHLSQALQDDGYRVQVFMSSAEFCGACAVADAEHPAAVVMDMVLFEAATAGAELLAELKASGVRCPPLVFLSVRDDLEARLAAFRAGACRYLVKPVESGRLIGLLDAITSRQPAQPYRVLLVDDDPLLLETYAAVLRSAGMEVYALSRVLQIMDALDSFAPDVVVLDVYMPEATGPELAAVLRERDEYLHLPILFLSAETDMTQQLLALNLGGDDFLVKPVQPDHLVSAITARVRRARQHAAIQHRLETALYEREREHLALDHHAIVSIADQAGNITYVNDKFCKVSGYTRGELLGHNHRIVKSGEHPPEFYQNLWHTITGGQVWQGEICNRRKDGSYYWVESTITPFLDGDGNPYQYVSMRTDITHVKGAEALLRLRTEAVEVALNPILIVDVHQPDMGIIYTNASFERLTGYSRGEVIGRNCRFLQRDDRGQPELDALRTAIRQGHDARVVLRNYRKDGSLFWNELSIAPVRDARNQLTHFIGVLHDVSERIRTNARIEQQRDMQSMISTVAAGLLAAPASQMDAAIGQTLQHSGEHLGADRAYLFLFSEDGARMSNTHEWCADGIEPQRDKVQNLPQEMAPWWWQRIGAGGMVVVPDVVALPPEAAAEKAIFEDQQIQSLFAFPLQKEGKTYGFIGFDAVRSRRDWADEDIELLRVVADVISSALARKRAEQAMVLHKERLRRGQLFANIGTWDWNVQSGELFWTERIAPLFGYPVAELETSYDNFLAAIHPDDRQAVTDAINACVERDVPYEIEHRVVWPDGTVRWLLERGAVVRDDDGKPLQMLGVVQDIDDRKKAEIALAERERLLREAQTLASIGNWTADLATGELIWSDEIYRIFGYEPRSFAPSIEAFHAMVHPDDRAGVRESEKAAERTGRHDVVHRILRPDGTVRHVHELAQAETDATDRLMRLAGTVQDITEQVETEQALIAARDEADRANKAKSEFLSSMSHELRTPMNAVLGFGQLMEYDDTLPGEHLDSVREILKAGYHLLELINEVLDLAKVESGQIDLSLEPVEVCPIVDECLGLVGPLADKRNIQLTHLGLAGAMVRADRTRLKQALLNLLANAIKYNREGGIVRLDVRPEGKDRLRIRVMDTGPGIPARRLVELFQPFNRLDAEGSDIEGTGIGLTITQRIVEMMGGAVGVESEVGIGSTFWIELPLESMADDACDHEGAAGNGATPGQHMDALQHIVLYIEDNPTNIKLVAQILGRYKHIHLLTAHSPEIGIELALARQPELILLDINMPGMDGYQVLEVFKADARLKTIPVVAVTANAMARDIERGKAAGFADYLTKPLDVERFHAVVDACLAITGKSHA
ncbi:MAG: PAS domain-containing protein [Thiobacillus sp.]